VLAIGFDTFIQLFHYHLFRLKPCRSVLISAGFLQYWGNIGLNDKALEKRLRPLFQRFKGSTNIAPVLQEYYPGIKQAF
jgi:hypothetical protein